jgi:hypothetical protein
MLTHVPWTGLLAIVTRKHAHSCIKTDEKGHSWQEQKHVFILPVFSTHATTLNRQSHNEAGQTPSVLFTSVIDSSGVFSASTISPELRRTELVSGAGVGTPSTLLSDGIANETWRNSRRNAEVSKVRQMRSSQMVSFSDRSHDDLNLGWVQFVSAPAVKRPAEAAVRQEQENEDRGMYRTGSNER